MFIIADQSKEGHKFQRKTIETQKIQSELLNKTVSLLCMNSRKMMAFNQIFYARDQMIQIQAN